jgi:WD40 repeat protein
VGSLLGILLASAPCSQPKRGRPVTLAGNDGSAISLAFSGDGKILAAGTNRGVIELWDIASRKCTATLKGHDAYRVESLAFSPDGKRLASGASCINIAEIVCRGGNHGEVKLWELITKKCCGTLGSHGKPVRAVAISPDGSALAVARQSGPVRLWTMAPLRETAALRIDDTTALDISFSPDSKALAIGCEDGRILFADLASGKVKLGLRWPDGPIYCLRFSPNGKLMAFSDVYKRAVLWHLAKKTQVACKGEHGWYASVAFSPDSKILVTGGGDTIELWEAATSGALATLTGHEGGIKCVAFSPDGRLVAAGGHGRAIWVWDIRQVHLRRER